MDRADYWRLIDEMMTQAGLSDRRQVFEQENLLGRLLQGRIRQLPMEEVKHFYLHTHQLLREAYCLPLWAAACLINFGCNAVGFTYFREWLILQGEDVFRRVTQDPDTLAAYLEGIEGGTVENDVLLAATREGLRLHGLVAPDLDALLGPMPPVIYPLWLDNPAMLQDLLPNLTRQFA